MKFIIEDSLTIYSQLLIPSLLVAIPGIIRIIIKIFLTLREKNKYSEHLKTNFPYIRLFLYQINLYKIRCIYIGSLFFFLFGFINGNLFEIFYLWFSFKIYSWVLGLNITTNILSGKLNLDSLSMNMISFNLAMIYNSCLNISIIVVIYVLKLWSNFLKSKNLLLPQITKYGQSTPMSSFIYLSYWFFMGVVIGINHIIYRWFFYYISKFLLIDETFSFSLAYFINLYINLRSNLLYPEFHICMYLSGVLGSSALIFGLYVITKRISNRIIELITRHYEYDFPYIKITTENGETKGRLKDIRNKFMITLSENKELKIVPWNKIEILEASHIDTNKHIILDNSSIK